MTEQFADVGGGITLAYEEIGDPAGGPVLLVAGIGQQLHAWPTPFCDALADRGYRVVRFDNRDAGRSTHLGYRPPSPLAILTRRWPAQQYDLTDMATDTAGLLDALGCADAHVVGMSMGGMIGQMVAAIAPARVRTLTSIMSTTGASRTGRPAPSTLRRMLAGRPATRAEAADRLVRMYRHIGSHGYPFDEAAVRAYAELSWDRNPAPTGFLRQLAAIVKSGDRTAALRSITAPTLVIHGDRDRMVHPSGGAATARAIPGSRVETITGMGHDLPRAAWPVLLDLIDRHARRRSTDAPSQS